MILPKNAASMISDSLASTRGESGHKEAEPMDEMEALGHSILQAIKANDPKALAEHLQSFNDACPPPSYDNDDSAGPEQE